MKRNEHSYFRFYFYYRTRLATWMSSHCPTKSRREVLVKELQRELINHQHQHQPQQQPRKFELKLDTFGRCGKRSCYRREPYAAKCWQRELSKYSFYLALENSVCPHYISEKAFIAMKYGLIPIVYGGG